MQIPDHLENLVRQLAHQRFIEAHNTFELLSRQCAVDHADVVKAKQLLDEAQELSVLAGEPVKAAA